MPDDRRFSDEEMERSLRDLGARMEYPPTPDVASTVRRRSAGRRAKLSLQVAAKGHVVSAPASPEAALVAAERREELLASVGELSEGERLVISYRYFLGLSEEETATTLGCARGTVKSRASRAIARLRKAMAREEDA